MIVGKFYKLRVFSSKKRCDALDRLIANVDYDTEYFGARLVPSPNSSGAMYRVVQGSSAGPWVVVWVPLSKPDPEFPAYSKAVGPLKHAHYMQLAGMQHGFIDPG